MTRAAWIGTDRRGVERVAGAGIRAHLRPGHRLVVLNFCDSGALVEATRPLRPGAHLAVQFDADAGQSTVAARVLRCVVSSIHREAGVTYRAALAFARPCAWTRAAPTPDGYALHERITRRDHALVEMGTVYPAQGLDDETAGTRGVK